MKLLSVQVTDGSFAYLAEVVGQNLGAETYGNAFGTLRQQQRELDGQRDWLLVATVVAQLPLRGLRIEDGVQSKLRQAGFDVSGSGGTVARQYVTPVSLRVNKQVFLA